MLIGVADGQRPGLAPFAFSVGCLLAPSTRGAPGRLHLRASFDAANHTTWSALQVNGILYARANRARRSGSVEDEVEVDGARASAEGVARDEDLLDASGATPSTKPRRAERWIAALRAAKYSRESPLPERRKPRKSRTVKLHCGARSVESVERLGKGGFPEGRPVRLFCNNPSRFRVE